MAILIIIVAVASIAVGAGVYVAATRPCENGFHRRHWRSRRFRPGGCSAVD